MALAAPRPCAHPRCSALVQGSTYCQAHARARQARQDQERGSSTERGYGYRWQVTRKGFLREHPFCAKCSTDAVPVLATEVDHITPHRGNMALFWDRANWQGLCHVCHSRKTATEDGGFGR
jgi:5-methylcytosine-specific restriction protein A